MKTSLFKTAFVLTSLAVLTACPAKHDDSKIVPTVGPQGRITAFGSNNTYCDISNGTIVCSNLDQSSGAVCVSNTKMYNTQDLNSFCQQVNALQLESATVGNCNVAAATNRILTENCHGIVQPNPINNPNNPNFPGISHMTTCKVLSSDSSFETTLGFSGGFGHIPLSGFKTGSFLWNLIKYYRLVELGEIRFNYLPKRGQTPESLTISVDYKDPKNNRTVNASHSGFGGAPVYLDARINDTTLSISCNENSTVTAPVLNEAAHLICTGDSKVVVPHSNAEKIQFNRPLSEIVSGHEMSVSEALSVTLDKATGSLSVRTVVDSDFGPDVTSSSLIKSGVEIKAGDKVDGHNISKVNLKCEIK